MIVTPQNKTILIDGGGQENYDTGERIIIPFLLKKGIMKIDYLIISHFDFDHVGGLFSIMQKLNIGQVIFGKQGEKSENYQNFKQIVNDKKIKCKLVNKGDKLYIEQDIVIDIIWPNNAKLINENVLNNNSIVCKLNYKQFSILFTGDIEEIAEKQILKEYKNDIYLLNSTILKIGHHGSKSSSSQEFLEAVKPKFALIGVGKNNKFGHPNDEVLKRLKNIECSIYRTDQMGEIMIKIGKRGNMKIESLYSLIDRIMER